jgi:hypothetical protein
MYEFKFLEYNQLTKEIMSEHLTLENIVDIVLGGKPSKEQKKYLTSSEEWAKYAFENEYKYYTTVYKNNSPYACISCADMDIIIDFWIFIMMNWLNISH